MADAVIAVDAKGVISVYNGAALNILDLNASMQGMRIDKVFKPVDDDEKPVDMYKYVRATTVPTISETLRLKYGDSSISNLFISVSPVYKPNVVEPTGYVLVLRDITRAKSLEEERNEFISVVSHELRTPIAITEGNIGNAEFIAEHTGDMKQINEALHEAHEQTLFLAALVNDLATLSRAERGKLNVEVEAVDVAQLVRELVAEYHQPAADKQLTITAETADDLPELHSSKLYVREILQNFITNSIKYTLEGGVVVGARAAAGGIEFWVHDTGIGISKHDQEKVFDKFFRSEDYRTRATNGTGLGLYVTAKLAHLLHADIKLESKPDHGSTFTIFVPDSPLPPKPSA